MGFFLDQKGPNRKKLKVLKPTKGQYPKLVAENKHFYFYLHTVQKTERKHCSVSVNLIRSMAIKGYIHT